MEESFFFSYKIKDQLNLFLDFMMISQFYSDEFNKNAHFDENISLKHKSVLKLKRSTVLPMNGVDRYFDASFKLNLILRTLKRFQFFFFNVHLIELRLWIWLTFLYVLVRALQLGQLAKNKGKYDCSSVNGMQHMKCERKRGIVQPFPLDFCGFDIFLEVKNLTLIQVV